MIIVVEGTKQSGKTTFINQLKKLSVVPVFHFYDRDLLKFNLNQADANFASCMSYLNAAIEVDRNLEGECFVVFDRFHLTEIVYGEQVRGYKNDKMWIVDQKLRACNIFGLLFMSDTAEERTGLKVYKKEFEKAATDSCLKWEYINLDKSKGNTGPYVMVSILNHLAEMRYD